MYTEIGTFVGAMVLIAIASFAASSFDLSAMLIASVVIAGVFLSAHFLHSKLESLPTVRAVMHSVRVSVGMGFAWFWILWVVFSAAAISR